MATSDLRRNLVVVLTIKAAIILFAAIFVFGPGQRPRIDPTALDHQILGHTNSAKQEPLQ